MAGVDGACGIVGVAEAEGAAVEAGEGGANSYLLPLSGVRHLIGPPSGHAED
jgi:hypothetical protein